MSWSSDQGHIQAPRHRRRRRRRDRSGGVAAAARHSRLSSAAFAACDPRAYPGEPIHPDAALPCEVGDVSADRIAPVIIPQSLDSPSSHIGSQHGRSSFCHELTALN